MNINQLPFLPINPLNADLNPIFHLLALLGAHHILHVSRIRNNTKQEKQSKCKVTMRYVRATIFCYGSAISIAKSECVSVALGIQHAMHMRLIILSSVTCRV